MKDYTDLTNLIMELALRADPNNDGYYYLWEVSISEAVLQHYVQQANEYTYKLFEDVTDNAEKLYLARQYATKLAALRLLSNMTYQWSVSGVRAGLGNISVDRLAAMREALNVVRDRLERDLEYLYKAIITLKVEKECGEARRPYAEIGGSPYWV